MSKYKIFSFIVYLNKEKYTIKTIKPITIEDLLIFFNYKKELIVIEFNNQVYNSENWSKKILKNNDQIEIITIVGGG
jgi:thiamine biosynthesis protein ThiS